MDTKALRDKAFFCIGSILTADVKGHKDPKQGSQNKQRGVNMMGVPQAPKYKVAGRHSQ
ncbi:hypothetical protein [Alteromonas gilva]|uniref:Uncharacterized protein n=1 Tax=Alteromonas gilva TaxID=2987522 RepID=A0ABT5KXZ5_9ALTE|nr:hypothetical protein [Alteromonas gilva]MDC8829640.1 hypothetical protein [Alteromonas gilva]